LFLPSLLRQREKKKRRPLSISWNLRWMFKEIFRVFCFFSFIWNKRGTKKENKLQNTNWPNRVASLFCRTENNERCDIFKWNTKL
jgi:hypothetical protein